MFFNEITKKNFIKTVGVAAIVFMMSGCEPGLQGTYSGTGSVAIGKLLINATFDSSTVSLKSEISVAGQTVNQPEVEYEYEVDDNKIKIKAAQGGAQIWTLEGDGSITVPMPTGDNIKLIKRG